MKAILLVRVSTEAQDFTEQEKEIYQMAIEDGYKPEDIIPICEKESGIKLEEEERAGLNRMKELIESNIGVDCVYCWEVSRIARRKKINFSVLDYLTKHKVQLIIKNPYITLFNRDGSINEGAEYVFSLFTIVAESEMRTKLVRFKRSKDARRKQGYFTGGILLFGYTADENNKIILKEGESDVVKAIFMHYLTGRYSYRSLAKELQDNGIFTEKSFPTAQAAVKKILTNTAYAGVPSADGSYMKLKTEGNVYPPIVTLDMIKRCAEISKKNIIAPKKKYSTYYYGKGILRCPECGKVMMAVKARNFYHCTKCECKTTININMVDSALWAVAAPLYTEKVQTNNDGQKKYYKSEIRSLKQKMNVVSEKILDAKNRAEKLEYKAYVDGTIDIVKADKMTADINKKLDSLYKEFTNYVNQRAEFEKLLAQYDSDQSLLGFGEQVSCIKDEKIKYEIVHNFIGSATIYRVGGYKMRIVINITDYKRQTHSFLLDSRSHKIYSEFTDDGIGLVELENAFEERFRSNYQLDPEERKAYQKEYRKNHKAENAERQKKYRQSQIRQSETTNEK